MSSEKIIHLTLQDLQWQFVCINQTRHEFRLMFLGNDLFLFLVEQIHHNDVILKNIFCKATVLWFNYVTDQIKDDGNYVARVFCLDRSSSQPVLCPRMNFPLAGCLLAMNFPLRWLFFANDFSLACCLFCYEFCPHLLFFGNEFPPRLLFFGNEFPTRLLFFGNDFCLDPFRSPETQPVRLTWLWPTTISIRLYVHCRNRITMGKSQTNAVSM